MPIQPMAMPGAAADPRPARARPGQGDGELRGAASTARKDPARREAEDADFADVHASLAPAEAAPAQGKTPLRPEVSATPAPAPVPTDMPADALAAEAEAPLVFGADSPDVDSAEAQAANAPLQPRTAAPAIDAAPPAQGDKIAVDAVVEADVAIAPAPLSGAAPGAAPEMPPETPELARAQTPEPSAGAKPDDARPAPRMTAEAAPPEAAKSLNPPAKPDGAAQVAAPIDQPPVEANAAAETTARRAEAALDRRADSAAAPAAPPPGTQTVQAVTAASTPVAVPQGPPQPTMPDARAAEGAIDVAAATDEALTEADALGLSAGPTERSAAAFAAGMPAADRTQAAAAMAQMAPTLRKGADGATEIRLDPPELGRVRLTLRTDEHGLVATVLAERPETMDMMRRNADMLLRDLMAGGQTKVDLSFGSLGPETGGGDGTRDEAPTVLVGFEQPGKAPGADLAAQLRLSRAAGGLDIRV